MSPPPSSWQLVAKLLAAIALGCSAAGIQIPFASFLLALGVTLLWTAQLLRLLMLHQSFGIFCLMIFRMLLDLGKWLVILSCIMVPTALGFQILAPTQVRSRGDAPETFGDASGEEGAATWWEDDCSEKIATLAHDLVGTVLLLTQIIFGGAEEVFGCLELTSTPRTAALFLIYYLVMTCVLLINLLIAIMSKTFDVVIENATLNFQHLLAGQVVHSSDEWPVPPPLSLLSLPYQIYTVLKSAYQAVVEGQLCSREDSRRFARRDAVHESKGGSQGASPASASSGLSLKRMADMTKKVEDLNRLVSRAVPIARCECVVRVASCECGANAQCVHSSPPAAPPLHGVPSPLDAAQRPSSLHLACGRQHSAQAPCPAPGSLAHSTRGRRPKWTSSSPRTSGMSCRKSGSAARCKRTS